MNSFFACKYEFNLLEILSFIECTTENIISTADKDESSNFSLLHQSELSNPLSSDSHILSFGMSPG